MRKLQSSIALAVALFCHPIFAASVSVAVKLSPAGDFKASSSKARGFVDKKGDEYSAGELSVSVGSLETGIELRDKHFRERLGGPDAKILVKDAKGKGGKGTGSITVNKVTKPFSFTYAEAGGQVDAKFSLKPSDFNIKDVKYLGVGVEDKVEVSAKFPVR